MKKIVLLIILSITIKAIAQDGSDIKYVKISEIDNSYIGKWVHLDFYNRSFGISNSDKKELTDRVPIEIENRKIEFSEHRVDNGYNNWFSEQYLESTEFIDGFKIRITMCKIKEISLDYIKVILELEYRDKNNQLNSKKLNTIEYDFPKQIVSEVIIRN